MSIENDMRGVCRQAEKLGYGSTLYAEMLKRYGGARTARRLLTCGDAESILEKLSELQRLDLSVEAAVLRYPQHFHESEQAVALRRLERYNYHPR
jgi:hypothetical protein